MQYIIVGITLISLAGIWAVWTYKVELLTRTKPLEVFHCCECTQFDRKCDAAECGVFFIGDDPTSNAKSREHKCNPTP